jgi:hypothetical protein
MLGRHEWVKAKGRVVAVDRHSTTMEGGQPGSYDSGYVIDVQPPDGEPFRAQVDPAGHYIGHFGVESLNFKHPNEGDVVSVEYDPASKKVRFDMSDPALQEKASRKARDTATHAEYEAALAAGSPESAVPEPGISNDSLDRLEHLGDLHEQGMLTDEEFAAAKAKLLGEV